MRNVLNDILYLLHTDCAWRAIPEDFPHWSVCRHYYDRFLRDGTWMLIHAKIFEHQQQQRTLRRLALGAPSHNSCPPF